MRPPPGRMSQSCCPLNFGTQRLVITGGLEPAYDVGGDSFDYPLNGSTADC